MRSTASTARCASIGSDLPRPRRVSRFGPLDLDHGQPGGTQRAGQADAVGAGAFQPYHDARAERVIGDPRQRGRAAGGVVADHDRGHRHPARGRHLQRMRVFVGVAADDGVHHICNHRHCDWSPSREPVVWSAPAWEDTPAAYL